MIGQGMDREAITAALDACLLTDAELAAGSAAWRRLDDPFPAVGEAPPAHDHEHEHAPVAGGR